MDTEVSIDYTKIEWYSYGIIGNEVADFVKEHLVQELKNLQSFKNGDYDQALKDIYLRMDDMLKTSYGNQKLASYRKGGNDANMFGKQNEEIAF